MYDVKNNVVMFLQVKNIPLININYFLLTECGITNGDQYLSKLITDCFEVTCVCIMRIPELFNRVSYGINICFQ